MKNLLYRVSFSAITRMVLGIALLFTDQLSVTFRYLIVVIFLLPVIRYILHAWQQTEMDVFFAGYPKLGVVNHFFILAGIAVLYVLVLAHVLEIYTTSYFWWILIIIAPAIGWYLLFGKDPAPTKVHEHNKRALLRTLAFYIIPFFFALNYAFDFSTPTVTRYYITRSDHTTHVFNDPDISEIDIYYFYLLPAESMTGPTRWQIVPANDYYGVKDYGPYKGKDSVNYLVMDKWKGRDSAAVPFRERFQLELLPTNVLPVRQTVPFSLYKRFKDGDYLNKEEHRGLLGIKWVSYH
ncbi:hypothetical protein QFZ51_004507 [Chitinophaga sp. W3I9]|uniref:hypothetical protein n=1 Tax=Chitinophaga sp. W3I9 TaxID=3373924 RepID=UPI003D23D03C